MIEEKKILIVFESTRAVILAEQECKNKGFKCIAVPAPREDRAQCGIALEVAMEHKEDVIDLLDQLGRPYRYYDKDKNKGKSCSV